ATHAIADARRARVRTHADITTRLGRRGWRCAAAGVHRPHRPDIQFAPRPAVRQALRGYAAASSPAAIQRHRRLLVPGTWTHAADSAIVHSEGNTAMNTAVDIHAAAFSLRIAGSELPDELAGAMTGWRVAQQLSRPSMCELQFLDAPAAGVELLRLG